LRIFLLIIGKSKYILHFIYIIPYFYESLKKKEMWRLSGLVFFFLASINAFSNIDSLRIEYEKSINKEEKAQLLFLISKEYSSFDKDSAIIFAEQAYEVSNSINDDTLTAKCINHIGVMYYLLSDYEKSIEYFKINLEIYERINYDKKIAVSLNNIAGIYYFLNNYDSAIDYYRQSIRIRENLQDTLGIAKINFNIGNIYKDLFVNEKALEFYDKALVTFKEFGVHSLEAATYNNLGTLYQMKEDYTQALENYKKAIEIRTQINDTIKLSQTYQNIASVYERISYLDSAEMFLNKALVIKKEIGEVVGIASCYLILGKIESKKGNYSLALKYFNKSLKGNLEINLQKNIIENYLNLSETHEKLNRFENALDYYKKYKELEDTLFSSERYQEIADVENKYEKEKSQLKIEKEKAIQEEKIQKQRVIIISIIVILVLVSLQAYNFFRRYRNKTKLSNLLKRKNTQINIQKEEIKSQRDEIEAQRDNILNQKSELEKVHKKQTLSINYAKNIQSAVLPSKKVIKHLLPEHFVFYKPQAIVSGDFYWISQIDDKIILAAADCTGHGVPGGFMSMLGIAFLNEIVNKDRITNVAEILNQMRTLVINSLHQQATIGERKDGMDISICCIDFKNKKLEVAGAMNPIYLVREISKNQSNLSYPSISMRNKLLYEIKVDVMPVSIYDYMESFSSSSVDIEEGDMIYMATDGFADQFGGENKRKYYKKNLKNLLLEIADKNINFQKLTIEDTFSQWKGSEIQIDDVLILGFRVS